MIQLWLLEILFGAKKRRERGGGGDGEETKVQSTLDIIIKSSLLCTFLERR